MHYAPPARADLPGAELGPGPMYPETRLRSDAASGERELKAGLRDLANQFVRSQLVEPLGAPGNAPLCSIANSNGGCPTARLPRRASFILRRLASRSRL